MKTFIKKVKKLTKAEEKTPLIIQKTPVLGQCSSCGSNLTSDHIKTCTHRKYGSK